MNRVDRARLQLPIRQRSVISESHGKNAPIEDRALSGASLHGRQGLAALMQDAANHRFDVVIVEELERLARDEEDLPAIYKRLTFHGVDIVTVHEGKADRLRVGIRAVIGAMYMNDLQHKVRRGMAGVVRSGRHAGGRAYGYRPVPGKPGELAILEPEAAVVRRIFSEYVAGRTPREIAAVLNRERVPPPRGTRWNASTINGNRSRGHGMLLNEIYAGRIVWNKVRMIKDPDTASGYPGRIPLISTRQSTCRNCTSSIKRRSGPRKRSSSRMASIRRTTRASPPGCSPAC